MKNATLYTHLFVVLIAALAAGGGVLAKEDETSCPELEALESEKQALSVLTPPNLQLSVFIWFSAFSP